MRLSPYMFLVALSLGVWSSTAFAQCPEDARLRTQHELEMTDARIEQAVSVVSESGNEMARLELRAAQETQATARAEFSAGHCRIATDLTMRARFRASHAIEIVRGDGGGLPPGGPDPGRVLGQLERTRDLLDRARDRIEECNNDQARAILRAAFEMQRRAEDAFAQQRGLAAHQLTVSARERALRALRLCNMQDNLHESAERALRRTDEVLSRARDLVAERDVDRARKVLRRALELQERATLEFRAEHYEASLRLTQSARTLAQRSIRLSGGAS
jgi:tetratricopeptide (TPR) repeat protein